MTVIIGAEKENKILETPSKKDLLLDPKIRHHQLLGNAIETLRKQRKLKIGFTNGKFKVLHPGHCVFLSLCRSQCDILVVGINSDYSLRVAKEESPFTDKERAFALASLSVVDYITIFDNPTPYEILSFINPDVVFKGPDYSPEEVVSGNRDVCIINHPFDVHSSDFIKSSKETEEEFKHFKVSV